MIDAPPFDAGGVHESATEVVFSVAESPVGEPGVVLPTFIVLVADGVPVPIPLIALTRKSYDVLAESPVTIAVVAVLTPSLNVVQLFWPVGLYCT